MVFASWFASTIGWIAQRSALVDKVEWLRQMGRIVGIFGANSITVKNRARNVIMYYNPQLELAVEETLENYKDARIPTSGYYIFLNRWHLERAEFIIII
jgi:hypothetical protein